MNKLNCIDLFAGAGGLSEGFTRCGFDMVAHVELDPAASYTLRTRSAYHYLVNSCKEDIYHSYLKGNISRNDLYSAVPQHVLGSVINARIGEDNSAIFKKIDDLVDGRDLDLVIGGPPCQAYSVVGRAPLKHKADDERTMLYIQYGRFLKKYKPKMFLFENVPGILSAADGLYFRNLKKYYKGLGYDVEAQLLNAKDFDVVQSRSRVIIIGWKKELGYSYPDLTFSSGQYTRDDIFSDLPSVQPAHNLRVSKYKGPINEYLKKTSIRNGVDFVTQHVTRPHNQNDLNIYKLAIKHLESGSRLKNDQIPENMRTQKNVSSFLDRFKVVGDVPHTMIAHIAKDGHHFIHPDIKQCRSISVREAARIQSFPDDFFFEGTKEGSYRSAAFKQIGNAVPPLMAEKIARKIKKIITS